MQHFFGVRKTNVLRSNYFNFSMKVVLIVSETYVESFKIFARSQENNSFTQLLIIYKKEYINVVTHKIINIFRKYKGNPQYLMENLADLVQINIQ